MKLLHFADAHLRDKDIKECEKCLNFIVETAEAESVDLIVFAGDFFHSQELKLDSQSAELERSEYHPEDCMVMGRKEKGIAAHGCDYNNS